jgi:hypothetical protein
MRLLSFAVLLLAASCNPGTRCSKATDCPAGATCSAGFCADYHVPGGNPQEVVDSDVDAGSIDAGTRPDGGPLDDGR